MRKGATGPGTVGPRGNCDSARRSSRVGEAGNDIFSLFVCAVLRKCSWTAYDFQDMVSQLDTFLNIKEHISLTKPKSVSFSARVIIVLCRLKLSGCTSSLKAALGFSHFLDLDGAGWCRTCATGV